MYLASAIVVAGFYVGIGAHPPLSRILFEKFGYHHAMAILSSFSVIHVVAGIFYIETTDQDDDSTTGSVKNIEYPPTDLEPIDDNKPTDEKFSKPEDTKIANDKKCNKEIDTESSETSQLKQPLKEQFRSLAKNYKVPIFHLLKACLSFVKFCMTLGLLHVTIRSGKQCH